jgi:hypothetical protein
MLQGPAIQILHGDKGLPFVFVNVVDGADVGVIERGCCPGLALEALEPGGVDRVGEASGLPREREAFP